MGHPACRLYKNTNILLHSPSGPLRLDVVLEELESALLSFSAYLAEPISGILGRALKRLVVGVDAAKSRDQTRVPLKIVKKGPGKVCAKVDSVLLDSIAKIRQVPIVEFNSQVVVDSDSALGRVWTYASSLGLSDSPGAG